MNPVIGYHNILETGTTVGSSEDGDNVIENCFDWRTFDWWKPSGSAQYNHITIDAGAAVSCDYLAIAAHDLLTQECGIALYYSSDNFSADNNAITFTTYPGTLDSGYVFPDDDTTVFVQFAAVSARYWRILTDNRQTSITDQPSLGVVALGAALELPNGERTGFTPPTLYDDSTIINNTSQRGEFLGRSIERNGNLLNLNLAALTPAFVRSDIEPFLTHAKTKPFFYTWDNSTYPEESCLAWTDGKIPAVSYSHCNFQALRLACKAYP